MRELVMLRKLTRLTGIAIAGLALANCSGDMGPVGARGPAGAVGTQGADGPTGAPGTAAVDTGTISGSVEDSSGAPLVNANIVTVPPSGTAVSDGSGNFILSDVPIGSYAVSASMDGYVASSMNGVGVAAGATATVALVLTNDSEDPATISGTIFDATGVGVEGAVVSVKGKSGSASTDASGVYTLTNVAPGFAYIYVEAPAGFLDSETRETTFVAPGATIADLNLSLSSYPSKAATYVGGSVCAGCHSGHGAETTASAHGRSITADTSHILPVAKALWPAVGTAGTDSGVMAISPVDGTTSVNVYMCQLTSDVYSMKFGGDADCSAADGSVVNGMRVNISGTYGGEGDGGMNDIPNLGKWKQRYLAKLADVPNASGWDYTSGKENDWLIMPVQVTQSGDAGPKFGAYHGGDWATRGRTFSKKCAGCHNTGLDIAWDASNVDTPNAITKYEFKDLNTTCEACHGPGSEHIAEPIATRALKIVIPHFLTAEGERQVCGTCHSADAGKSVDPAGGFGYPYNASNAAELGGGLYVPGVYDLVDYIKGYGVPESEGGGVANWPDGIHGKAHRQQVYQLGQSVHTNNPYEQVTCSSCHDVHSLVQGPGEFELDEGMLLDQPVFNNNSVCFGCHATHGPFEGVTKKDVAALHTEAGGEASQDGTTMTFSDDEYAAARLAIATAVGMHMDTEVGMGMAMYDPTNDDMPVGRCASCHMPKTPKSGGWTTGLDANGNSALVAGDQSSHVFQVIWPWQSAALKTDESSDTDIMPNSCGGCHDGSRISGD